jgi:hypothetical protein
MLLVMLPVLAGQILLAQINLPGIPRRPPVQRPATNPGAQNTPGRGVASADQCRALFNWASILDREYPAGTVRMVPAPNAQNLFRDEYFVPFYGRPFAQTTDQERAQYLVTVFRGCGLNQLSRQELMVIQKYRMVLEPPFQYGSATVIGQQFAKNLADRQALARWRDEALRGLNGVPATLEGFDRLESLRKKGETDLTPLLPSEKQRFLQTLVERRKLFAPALAEQLMQIAAAIPAGPDAAKAITTLRARYETSLADADPAVRARVAARLDELIAASLADRIQAQKARLSAAPAGIDGAVALAGWQREFEIQFAGVSATLIQALRAEGAAKRRDCLNTGLAEFKTIVSQYPNPGHGGIKADELLALLFPPGQAAPPESGAYTAAFNERTKQIREEEDARAFREEQLQYRAAAARPAAKQPVDPKLNPCDALAGHPGDPNVKGDGVFDAELDAAEAVKACTLALKQQPKSARFQFQLGRAWWVGKQYDKAVASLAAAQGMEYAAAYHYLGLAYEQGKVKGEPADRAFAADLFKLAIAGGFNADAVAIGAMPEAPPVPIIEKADDLDATQLKEPAFVKAIFAGDFGAIQGRRRWVLVWATGIQSFLSLDPNEYDPSCLKLYDASLDEKIAYEQTGVGDGKVDMNVSLSEAMRLLRTAAQNPGMLVAESERNEQIVQNGVDDINVLSEDYGSCGGPVVRRFYRNLARFIKEKPAATH